MVLETKGGSIQRLLLESVTHFGTDLVVGDVDGTLTLFSKNQILSRVKLFEGAVTALVFDWSSNAVAAGARWVVS